MKYHHIIWDFDGTLFDTYPAMAGAFHAALAERAIDVPIQSILADMKISAGYAMERYRELYNLDDDFQDRYRSLKKDLEAADAKPFPDAKEICSSVHNGGGFNYLFTHRGESANSFLAEFGFAQYFRESITAKHNFPRKPSPEAILYLLERYQIPKEEVIMIGDRDIDLLSAKNAGIATCFFQQSAVCCDVADYTIHDLSELASIINFELEMMK